MAINIPAAADVAAAAVVEEEPVEAFTPIFCSEPELTNLLL